MHLLLRLRLTFLLLLLFFFLLLLNFQHLHLLLYLLLILFLPLLLLLLILLLPLLLLLLLLFLLSLLLLLLLPQVAREPTEEDPGHLVIDEELAADYQPTTMSPLDADYDMNYLTDETPPQPGMIKTIGANGKVQTNLFDSIYYNSF